MNNLITQAEISDVLDLIGESDEIITYDYSGRFMYGASCFGIMGAAATFARFMGAFGVLVGEVDGDVSRVLDLADAVRSDNMASDTIYYFPGWSIEDEPKDEDES